MREFAKISSEFWTSPLGKKVRGCEAEAKILVFYLMTCRHTNMLGIYYLPLALASHEIGIAIEGVQRGIEGLINVGFCSYDEESEYVWVHETAASQLGVLKKNDNRVKHANRVFKNLPKLPFLSNFYEKYCDLLHLDPPAFFCLEESPFEALEIRDGRLDMGDERLEKKKIPIIFGGESKKNTTKASIANSLVVVKKIDRSVFTIPLRQEKIREITEAELAVWQQNYPTIDVRQEIRQLIAWNQANPDRQKTERGINRHIQGWLSHAQQKQTRTNHGSPRQLSTWEHNMAVMQAVLEEDYASQ